MPHERKSAGQAFLCLTPKDFMGHLDKMLGLVRQRKEPRQRSMLSGIKDGPAGNPSA